MQRNALRLKGEAVQRDAMVPRANRRPGPSRRRPHRGDAVVGPRCLLKLGIIASHFAVTHRTQCNYFTKA